MGVTDFGAYLRSPYLFYLERELRLREVPEHPVELDRRAFGELLHEVLRSFAAGPEQDSQDTGLRRYPWNLIRLIPAKGARQ